MSLEEFDWSLDMFVKCLISWFILPFVICAWPVLHWKYQLSPSRNSAASPSEHSDP